jgi:hypothetical protein
MRNLLYRLRAAWLFSKSEPYVQLPSDYWTNENARTLSSFLSSTETGRKLRFILGNRVTQSAIDATLKNSTQYDSGYAGGIRGTVATVDSLLKLSSEANASLQNNEELGSEANEFLEQYRP